MFAVEGKELRTLPGFPRVIWFEALFWKPIATREYMHKLPVMQILRLIQKDDTTPVRHAGAKHHIPPITLSPWRRIAKAIHQHAKWRLCYDRRIQLSPALQLWVGRYDQTLRFAKALRTAFASCLIQRHGHHPGIENNDLPFMD